LRHAVVTPAHMFVLPLGGSTPEVPSVSRLPPRASPVFPFFFSSRRRHTRSVSAFLLNRSSDLRRLRSFAASWLLNALLRIFAMSIITPKRKVLRMSVQDCWRPPL